MTKSTDQLVEQRMEILRRIDLQREEFRAIIQDLELPARRVQKGFLVASSLPRYWRFISLAIGVVQAIFSLKRFFMGKTARPVAPSPKTWRQTGILWIGRIWRVYQWYVSVRKWMV